MFANTIFSIIAGVIIVCSFGYYSSRQWSEKLTILGFRSEEPLRLLVKKSEYYKSFSVFLILNIIFYFSILLILSPAMSSNIVDFGKILDSDIFKKILEDCNVELDDERSTKSYLEWYWPIAIALVVAGALPPILGFAKRQPLFADISQKLGGIHNKVSRVLHIVRQANVNRDSGGQDEISSRFVRARYLIELCDDGIQKLQGSMKSSYVNGINRCRLVIDSLDADEKKGKKQPLSGPAEDLFDIVEKDLNRTAAVLLSKMHAYSDISFELKKYNLNMAQEDLGKDGEWKSLNHFIAVVLSILAISIMFTFIPAILCEIFHFEPFFTRQNSEYLPLTMDSALPLFVLIVGVHSSATFGAWFYRSNFTGHSWFKEFVESQGNTNAVASVGKYIYSVLSGYFGAFLFVALFLIFQRWIDIFIDGDVKIQLLLLEAAIVSLVTIPTGYFVVYNLDLATIGEKVPQKILLQGLIQSVATMFTAIIGTALTFTYAHNIQPREHIDYIIYVVVVAGAIGFFAGVVSRSRDIQLTENVGGLTSVVTPSART